MNAKSGTPVSVVLIDDRTLVREGLRALIEQQPDFRVVAHAGSLEDVVALDVQPDVVMTELGLPDGQGRAVLTSLRERFPDAGILVVTDIRHPTRVRRAVAAGADGYLLKRATVEDLFVGIHTVARGESYLQPSLGVAVARRDARLSDDEGDRADRLSPREEEVVGLIALGLTNTEIAERGGVSRRTVETQRARIMQKLGHPTRAELVRYAREQALFELDE